MQKCPILLSSRKNDKFFLIFTKNQGKIFLILPITGGGTCMPSLHWESPPRGGHFSLNQKRHESSFCLRSIVKGRLGHEEARVENTHSGKMAHISISMSGI